MEVEERKLIQNALENLLFQKKLLIQDMQKQLELAKSDQDYWKTIAENFSKHGVDYIQLEGEGDRVYETEVKKVCQIVGEASPENTSITLFVTKGDKAL